MLPYLANLLATVLAAVQHDLLQCVAVPCLAAAGSVRLGACDQGQIARRYPGHPSLVLGGTVAKAVLVLLQPMSVH